MQWDVSWWVGIRFRVVGLGSGSRKFCGHIGNSRKDRLFGKTIFIAKMGKKYRDTTDFAHFGKYVFGVNHVSPFKREMSN
jgi:hypothetical protein